ncbi:MAG: 4-hydroxy-tetrahydrodipicolinate reductase [Planctomycetota bacterium]|nr:4-hydroxy-tetrahydrodipicolinate reductase [Planctomycetota bacterium]
MTRTPIHLFLNGASGRMGCTIKEIAKTNPSEVTITHERDANGVIRSLSNTLKAEVLIDFSSDEGALASAALAQELQCPLLCASTGLSPSTIEILHTVSRSVPVLIAPNTSLGVAVARRLTKIAARLLDGFDVSIIETHHTQKKDAPSGTALALAQAVLDGSNRPLSKDHIQSIRTGHVVGHHEVLFAGPSERLTIIHEAENRLLFALGAIRLGRWLAHKKPGLHTIDQWLDEKNLQP